ncbi:MAG: SUMF1/EgtB/PvdO family nonheme iron enzyme [Verrucomicrobia bacterium]|nr:SUMF1/EgtB/PvdO family nonheme iron enzyme [Verrucomicrobiota bacterium]
MNTPQLPELVSIPAGTIDLGVPACPPRSNFAWVWHTGRTKSVKAFKLARYHVTNAEYRVFLAETGHSAPAHISQPGFNGDRLPVVGISWEDATAYCAWLARRTGKPYRLPTDAEWEYAARGGRAGTIFPWGNGLDPEFAWFGGQAAPKPVGSYAPNGFGLHDMIGNAWQWCEERFEDVSEGVKAVNRPTGRDPAVNRVLRGGSFLTCHYLNLWIAYRHEDPPDLKHESIGFRLAL